MTLTSKKSKWWVSGLIQTMFSTILAKLLPEKLEKGKSDSLSNLVYLSNVPRGDISC